MNLIFLTDLHGDMIAVNPEQIMWVSTEKDPDIEDIVFTVLSFTHGQLAVKESFDSVINALNAWRKKQ